MSNAHVFSRLRGILNMLKSAYQAGAMMSSASKGTEREAFVNHVLAAVIAPPFRIGSGDITDSAGHCSGQLDIVIEFGNSISFAQLQNAPRLYLAEGVCAVIEVKSNIESQWKELISSHSRLAPLQTRYQTAIVSGGGLMAEIPHFGVGFSGWKTKQAIHTHFAKSGLAGLLVIDAEIYVSTKYIAAGEASLLGFFSDLNMVCSSMFGSTAQYLQYGMS